MKKVYDYNGKNYVAEFYSDRKLNPKDYYQEGSLFIGFYEEENITDETKVTVCKIPFCGYPGAFNMMQLISNLENYNFIKNYNEGRNSFQIDYKNFKKYSESWLSFDF